LAVYQLLPGDLIRVPDVPQANSWLFEHLGAISAPVDRDLARLIGAWYQHVAKLHADLPFGDDDRTVWGSYDLVAAVTIRSRLEKKLHRAEEPVYSSVRALVDEVDSEFRSFTEADEGVRLARLDGSTRGRDEWWWARVPIDGPARRELDSFMP
jgi:hypothetical protein